MERRRPRRRVRVGDLLIDHDAHLVTYVGEEVGLTLTEYNLLHDLMNNAGHVLSKRQLLEHVWGFDDYNPNLVEVHIAALRKKLGPSGSKVIETVRGVGYVIRPRCQSVALEGANQQGERS
jgi:two-component system OmpR family response regulator